MIITSLFDSINRDSEEFTVDKYELYEIPNGKEDGKKEQEKGKIVDLSKRMCTKSIDTRNLEPIKNNIEEKKLVFFNLVYNVGKFIFFGEGSTSTNEDQ